MSKRTRAVSVLVGLVIAAPFYWLLIDTTSSPELIAGGVAAVISAAAFSAAYLESTESAAVRLRWLSVVLREIARVPRGVLVVTAEVARQTVAPRRRRGDLEVEPFPAGEGDAYVVGRTALVEAFRSLAPDTIAIGADPESDRLILHRIGGRP